MLHYRELTHIHLPALVEVLHHRELTYRDYLILGIYSHGYSGLIDSFVTTTPIEGDDGMLYHRELSHIHLSDLGGVLHYRELTYLVLPSTSMLRTDTLICICQRRNHDKEITISYCDDSYRRG
jgi:hypothetical protein